ncbi:MAG: DUF2298 domain-containing protein [Chloroflexota bacterium]|nr:DUF2298 domain-containing protein [Chloroflexota bacterium]
MAGHSTKRSNNTPRGWGKVVLTLLLIVILLGGAYLRLTGVNWDENQHMHPDERFLSLVQSAISPVKNLSEYFNSEASSLNPANRGYTFFVYGTLPVFIIQYLGEALGKTDYHTITIVGRYVSAIFDLVTVLLVFAIGKRLYHKWVGLLGALFYALAVLPIQLSHYMTVDTITNTFAFLAVYAAVWALDSQPTYNTEKLTEPALPEQDKTIEEHSGGLSPSFDIAKVRTLFRDLAPYILFGIALGAATASKINAVVLAIILPVMSIVQYFRMDTEKQREALLPILRNLLVAGIVSFVVFRIGQPYAFNGPGFFNIGIDENWWSSLQNLRTQSSGDVDFPPALQWARRPITFSGENLIRWGLGLPLGLFACLSYLGMGWQILRKQNWHKHLPLWIFTGLYFIWQSASWVRSMRYQMLIYPALALYAGWGLYQLWSRREAVKCLFIRIKPRLIRITGVILAVLIIISTAIWAFSFSRIYTRPHTRVAASRWIYQNIPGALTLVMETTDGDFQQPLPYRAGDTLSSDETYRLPFYAVSDGSLTALTFPYILDESQNAEKKVVSLSIISAEDPEVPLGKASVESAFLPLENEWRGASYEFTLETPIPVHKDALYYLQFDLEEGDTSLLLNGSPSLHFVTSDGIILESQLPRLMQSVKSGAPYTMSVLLVESGAISEVYVPYLVDTAGVDGEKDLTLVLEIINEDGARQVGYLKGEFSPSNDIRGASAVLKLPAPLIVEAGQTLNVTLTTETEGVQLVLHAPSPVHESSWDDAVPYPVDGFSPYSENGGIYRGDLNFEMYWADDQLKLGKFETNLDLADYIFITSSRQWGTTTRVPERYLLTTFYYRNLLGCPEDSNIEWCYNVAEPGMFEGTLGFELVETFQSNPNLGGLSFNTQFAEEAFTVYDHPKVLIFKKTDAYDPLQIREILRSVDLSKVVYFTPGDAASYQGSDPDQVDDPRYTLNVPKEHLEEQRQGGTWAELFDRGSLLNTSQPLAAIVFYLFVLFLGLICYPIVRLALPGLSDRGYPLSKLAGLLILAFGVWILGSLGVSVTSTTILFVLIGIASLSIFLIFLQRHSLWTEIKINWRYYLTVEVLALVAFVLFLLVRFGNPDLWHPYKGGEKPMDFSYLNAVIKSTTFPPYDPWFAGGYINYYYYGFVIVGVPIKLLGIVPAIAYNIVLPIWFSLLILGAFSVGWNLYRGIPRSRVLRAHERNDRKALNMAFIVGLATVIILAVLGNLGTVKLIISGYQQIAAGGAVIAESTIFQKISWTLQGFAQFLRGTPMPFYPGDWYWYPSRVIPGEPITEFPYFSFIYGDLHAHLIAFPITVLAISWSLSVVLNKGKWGDKDDRLKILGGVVGFLMGGLVIGALRPTNTWDFYTYIVLAVVALFYSILKHYQPRLHLKFRRGDWVEKISLAIAAVSLLVLLSLFLYEPFSYWFGQGYTQVEIWEGSRTPLNSYLTHWGLFLFIIFSWMSWETYHWMKTTPHSALHGLDKYQTLIYAGLILYLIILVVFLILGVVVALVAIPMAVWALVLMFRPGRSDGRRFLLFLIGTAVTLTLVVEFVYLPGDIGRMNTVFKIYLQAWMMFALSAGVCFGWLVKSIRYWHFRLAFVWQVVLFSLLTSALLFTAMGTRDKINDRMALDAPKSLDGMAYMADATYFDLGEEMALEEDYHAIQWMQENIDGSPVILEGQAYEYRWGNRFTIYTGLPGVVGWNWHQRQQRAILRNNIVQERVDAVNLFYTTEEKAYVLEFIDTYDVSYIVLGQLERIFYPGPGLEKFELYKDHLWEEVYRSGDTIIYKVLN